MLQTHEPVSFEVIAMLSCFHLNFNFIIEMYTLESLVDDLPKEGIPAFSKNLDFLAFESHIRNTLHSMLEPIQTKYSYIVINIHRSNETERRLDLLSMDYENS